MNTINEIEYKIIGLRNKSKIVKQDVGIVRDYEAGMRMVAVRGGMTKATASRRV